MKNKGIWILTLLNILMFVGFLTGCGESVGAETSYDWSKPNAITWYGMPEGVRWEVPQKVIFKDNYLIIIAKDGKAYGVFKEFIFEFPEKKEDPK